MNPQILLLSVGIVFWGWFNQAWIALLFLLTVIAFAELSKWRLRMTLAQFYRVGDLSIFLVIIVLIIVYWIQPVDKPIFAVIKWLPVLFSPVLFAQIFSPGNTLPQGVLFYSMRKQSSVEPVDIDFRMPFSALCLLSAGAANTQGPVYFILSGAIFSAIIYLLRPKQIALVLWLTVIVLAGGIAHFGHHGLRILHTLVEEQSVEWFNDWAIDPFKSQTSIGDIGDLKLSDRIEFRVRTGEPLLLQQSSYDRYLGKNWLASRRTFKPAKFKSPKPHIVVRKLQIYQDFKRKAILALPPGTLNIKGLEGAYLQNNALGAVKLTEAPAFAKFEVFYTGKQQSAIGKYDLEVPEQHIDWLEKYAQQLRLKDLPPSSAASVIKQFFQNNFYYSLYLGRQTDADLALREFMLERKAGHCEYFAVASVLLLRYAGIPARLANGYSVQEYDPSEDMYIVRRRHAHAWALAYIDGVWREIDSTPWQWFAAEEKTSGLLQPIFDAFSTLQFHFKLWQTSQSQDDQQSTLSIAGISLLMLYLCWKLYASRKQLTKKTTKNRGAKQIKDFPGIDSEIYLLEKQLHKSGRGRHHNESIAAWIKRIDIIELSQFYKMHYQLRFDPFGVSVKDREYLKAGILNWIDSETPSE